MNYIKTLLNAISLRLNEIISRLNKVDEKTLPEPTADGNALIAVNGEWIQQDGYGYVSNEANITWDGNTEGKYRVTYTSGIYWYLIDDNADDFNESYIKYTYRNLEKEIKVVPAYSGFDGVVFISDESLGLPLCVICLRDNVTVEDIFTFEHKGIYAIKSDSPLLNLCVNYISLRKTSYIDSRYIDGSGFVQLNKPSPQLIGNNGITIASSLSDEGSPINYASLSLNDDADWAEFSVYHHNPTKRDESNVVYRAEPNKASIELETIKRDGSAWPMMSMFVSTERDEPVKQISGLTTPTESSHAANKKYVDDLVEERIGGISELIPSTATSQNKLADKAFVNSTVGTNTAIFRGTFNSLQELEAYSGDKTNNDYAFVIDEDSDGNTVYNRYKYNGTSFVYEYSLNNSSFTSDQWAAIQSGITSNDVALIESAIQPDDLSSYRTALEQDTIDNTKQPKTVSSEYYDATTVEGALDEIAQKAGELPSDTDDADEVSIDSTITAQSTGIPTSAAVIAYINSLGTVEGGSY